MSLREPVPAEVAAAVRDFDEAVTRLRTTRIRAEQVQVEPSDVDPDVLARAAARADAPAEARALAKAVAEGRTTWAAVASGRLEVAEVRELVTRQVSHEVRRLADQEDRPAQ